MHWLSAALLLGVATSLGAATVTVEHKSLASAPREIISAINRYERRTLTGDDGASCKYIGAPIALEVDAAVKGDWLVTTANACEWAASAAPIWIVHRAQGRYEVVLFHVTYSITIGQSGQHGLRHIATSRATATRYEEEL